MGRVVVAAMLLVAPAAGATPDDGKATEPFRLVGPVGPDDASFPFSMSFSPDGKWVAFADDHRGYLEIYEVDGWRRAWPAEGPWRDGSTHWVAFSSDSKRLYAVHGGSLLAFVLGEGGWKREEPIALAIDYHVSSIDSPQPLTVAPTARTTRDVERVVFVVEKELLLVSMPSKSIERRPLSGDGGRAHVLPNGTFTVADRTAARTHFEPPSGEAKDVPGFLVAVGPEGKRLLFAKTWPSREKPVTLEVRDAAGLVSGSFEAGTEPEVPGHSAHRALMQAAFSADGDFLVTVESRGDIVVREAGTAKPLQRIRNFHGYPMGAVFSPDGEMLLTAGRGKTADGKQIGILLWRRTESATR